MPDAQNSGLAPLAGAVVCCTSLDIADRDEIHAQATTLGAEKCTFDLTMDVTHLVVGATNSPKYKFVAKNSPDVHVVTPDFIRAMRLAWMAGEEVDLDEFHNVYKAPPLYKLRVSLTGFTDPQTREKLMSSIKENGADYCPDLDRTVTHLIAKSPSGRKYDGAAERGVTVVAEEWLYDSITRGMALDETLYDVRMDPAQRGMNAWNREHVPKKFTLGKRTRQEDLASDQPGRRKLRRTISAKLGSAHDAIWADIKSRPVENPPQSEWQGEDGYMPDAQGNARDLNRADVDLGNQQNESVDRASAIHSRIAKGLFSQKMVFIHGFPDSKYSILEQHIASRGGSVFKSEQALHNYPDCRLDSGSLEINEVFLITPYDYSEDSLPSIPERLLEANRVTEWWVESCVFKNTILDPSENRLCQPFFSNPIQGFESLLISSTAFVDEEVLHISKMITLLGATYEQYLKPGISVLISASPTPSIDKLRFAKENNIPVVSVEWLWSCIDTDKMVPFDEQLLGKQSNSQDMPTYLTTDTMTLPSGVIGKSHNERSWKSDESNKKNQPSQATPDPSPVDHLHTDARLNEVVNEKSAMPTVQPLREVSPEKLNSPKKSPQRLSPPEGKTIAERNANQVSASSAKSEVLTREISEILAAKRAARRESQPNSEEPNPMPRRNRSGLGRAASLGLANRTDQNKPTSVPLVTEESSLSENILLSQKVVYGDSEALEKRQQLLAELKGEIPDKTKSGSKETKESISTTKRKSAASGKGRSRRRN